LTAFGIYKLDSFLGAQYLLRAFAYHQLIA